VAPATNGTGGDARLVELLSGAGHGLLSGRDPGTVNVPYVGVPTDRTGPVSTTKLAPSRPQLAWWWMLLLAIALGLACGAIAGILTLV
jgi:ribose/xylose/arabinose/galactoside ABC-type transport system permease subunit